MGKPPRDEEPGGPCRTLSSGHTLTFLLDGKESGGGHLGGLGGLVPAVCRCWDKCGDTLALGGGSSSSTRCPQSGWCQGPLAPRWPHGKLLPRAMSPPEPHLRVAGAQGDRAGVTGGHRRLGPP